MKTMNKITLDWDDCTADEARTRLYIIYLNYDHVIKEMQWRFSARKGFHVRIILNINIGRQASYLLRRKWWDDGNRLVLDILRGDKQPQQVLWTKKHTHGFSTEVSDWYDWRKM